MSLYSRSQRWTALVIGVSCHLVFIASLTVMFVSLYRGLSQSWIPLPGVSGWVVNLLLVVQFAVGHSWLLSDKGRRLLVRLAPFDLGKPLATTLYAAVASLQLLLLFLFWSPSQVLWSAPEGWIQATMTGVYMASWLLLLKAMKDAGLEIQLGYLGWTSVWSGKEPAYKSFARSGLFKHARQPIYLAFTLILWSAPTWTPDHLFLAIALTLYCVAAPLLKEKRYLRWHGDAFRRYQTRVPYWIPGGSIKHKDRPEPVRPIDHEVVIVGAGPVGLLLASLLGSRGIHVLLLERRTDKVQWSQAIGITPPSLDILAKLGLDEVMVKRGVPIRDCRVYGESGYLGSVSFRNLEGKHRYVLSLPQMITMDILEQETARHTNVTVRMGIEVLAKKQTAEQVTLQCREVNSGESFEISAAYAVACDGNRSRLRDLLKIRTHAKSYGCHFVMGDFYDSGTLGDDAHLFFTTDGAVESFPLPGQKRRWIVQTPEFVTDPAFGLISTLVKRRTGISLDCDNQINQNAFSPRRLDCEVYHDGRVLLCGDAAHVMSPIGGQGMNTGFADADFAADVLHAVLRRSRSAEEALEGYDKARRRVARSAASRAALGMNLGIWTGRWRSCLRDILFRRLFSMESHLARWFAMRSLPSDAKERALLAGDARPIEVQETVIAPAA
jgi:2-polyprenyl-6-methoxyphenol hydroxylase-like FAD-dependent oxidoreductase/protein-S-isoprenylcysteine O-methyltransferase Ste14